MTSIEASFDPKQVAAFKKALPKLRRKLGRRRLEQHDRRYGVDGTTLRAIRVASRKPSITFREWAERICESITTETLRGNVRTPADFDRWHASLVASLQRHFRKNEGAGLSVAHRYKLVDLLIKWISQHDWGDKSILSGLERHANCALDSQTIKKMNACLSHAMPIRNPSMGDVQREATYRFCQELIGTFAAHCGGSRLLFDFYAWKPGGSANA